MKYGEIAELLLRNEAGGDVSQDFSIKEDEVFARISAMLPFYIRKDFYETYALEAGGLDTTLYTTFTANVVTKNGQSYLILPSAPFIIHGRGIPQLYYTNDIETQFTFVDLGQYRMYKSIGVTNEVKSIIYYYELECDEHRLVFVDDVSEIDKLKVRMIQGIGKYNRESSVPEHLVEPIMQALRAWYSPQANEQNDMVNDGKNNPPGGVRR